LVHPLLGYLSLGGITLLFILTLVSEISTKRPIQQAHALTINNASKLNKQLQNADAIEAMGMLTLKSNWQEQHNKVLALQTQIADKTAGLSSLSRFVRVLLQSIALGAGALLVIGGHITPGLMIAASIILGRVLNPVEQVIGSWKQFVQFRSAWHQLSTLLKEYPAPKEVLTLPRPNGNISVESVFAAASPASLLRYCVISHSSWSKVKCWGLSALQPQEKPRWQRFCWCLETVIRESQIRWRRYMPVGQSAAGPVYWLSAAGCGTV
jgi:ATP-binding cassette subfamily C exporter for protease/lipase